MSKKQYFVLFDGDHPTGPDSQAAFVELEDETGRSVRGEWLEWGGGWKLAIPRTEETE